MELLCEELDLESSASFTLGLAFEEDLEEACLLALTLRRPRPEAKLPREPGDPPEEPEEVKPIGLQVNGQVALEELGAQGLSLDVALNWEERRTVAKHRWEGPVAVWQGFQAESTLLTGF